MFKYDVGVVGACGHVGLPLCLVFANEGKKVLGFDVNKKSIEMVNNCKMPFHEDSSQELLEKTINKNFFLTSDHKDISECENIIVIIGTPIDKDFTVDLSHLEGVMKELLPYFRDNQLIVFRSTLAPKTSEYLRNFIESKTNFKIGENFFLADVPERLTQNNAVKELKELPNIIGVFDDKSFERASSLFKVLHPTVVRLTPLEAELAKLFTNSYRAATFALANEYLIISETLGANFYKIRHAINHEYPRGGVPKSGFAKGPCLGKDSWILLNAIPHLNMATTMVSAAYRINDGLPGFILHKLKEKGDLKNKKVSVLGLTFKKDSDDIRDSLSLKLVNMLRNEFVDHTTHDPYVDNKDLKEMLPNSDVVILATNHSYYDTQQVKDLIKNDALVVDVWNAFGKDKLIFNGSELR
jgi:UDP-N-acetyl-D-mannosaminuronic acid dehydrogenase